MARRTKTNPHELQAKWSLLLAIAAGLSTLLLILGVLRHFSFADFAAYYVKNSLRFYGIIATTLFSLTASGIGFFLALNSAGQRRNTLSGLAWKVFFIHALIITVTACVFIAFFWAKEEVIQSA
ncbi:MAG: hypothetical protein KKI02_08500 [Planctomycetes bacterium]|nr:hypothetical protein [Planctomycetota bacterium]